MKYKMCRLQCVLALVALLVGLAHSWDIAIAERDRLKLYSNGTIIESGRLNTQSLRALAYDDVNNMLLYVNEQSNDDAICSYDLTSETYEDLTEKNYRKIHSLAFDPVTKRIFFTDTNERSINWFSLESDYENDIYGNLLIKLEEGIPTDIAVDSCRGYVYWMNTNLTQPSIERARFNGTDRKVVINTVSLSIDTTYKLESHSLTIDQNTQKMFWYEPSSNLLHRIFSADLDGGNKQQISKYTFLADQKIFENPSNTMTVSKNGLILWGWCSNCAVWEIPKTENDAKKFKKLITLHSESPIGIVAKYTIEEQIQGLKDCEALKSLV